MNAREPQHRISDGRPVSYRRERRTLATWLRRITVAIAAPLFSFELFGPAAESVKPFAGFALFVVPIIAVITAVLKRGIPRGGVFRNAESPPGLSVENATFAYMTIDDTLVQVVADYPLPGGHVYWLPTGERIVARGAAASLPSFGLGDRRRPRPLASLSAWWLLGRFFLVPMLGSLLGILVLAAIPRSDAVMFLVMFAASLVAYTVFTKRTTVTLGADGVRLKGLFVRAFAGWGFVAVDRVRRTLTLHGKTWSFTSGQYDLGEIDSLLLAIETEVVANERFALHPSRRHADEDAAAFRVRVAADAGNYRIATADDDAALLTAVGVPDDVRIAAALRERERGGDAPLRIAQAADAALDPSLAEMLQQIASGAPDDRLLEKVLARAERRSK